MERCPLDRLPRALFPRIAAGLKYADAKAVRTASRATRPLTAPWRAAWDDDCFRANLAVGDVIDAKDTEGTWYDAVVEAIVPRPGHPADLPGAPAHIPTHGKDRVKVHYRGWTPKWDTWFNRHSDGIQPLFARSEDWRDLRVGDVVEIREIRHFGATPTKPLWFEGEVTKVDLGDEQARVYIKTPSNSQIPPRWVSTQSEDLCNRGTHIPLTNAPRDTQMRYANRHANEIREKLYAGLCAMGFDGARASQALTQSLNSTRPPSAEAWQEAALEWLRQNV